MTQVPEGRSTPDISNHFDHRARVPHPNVAPFATFRVGFHHRRSLTAPYIPSRCTPRVCTARCYEVPEGRTNLAQPFSAGNREANDSSPRGTLHTEISNHFDHRARVPHPNVAPFATLGWDSTTANPLRLPITRRGAYQAFALRDATKPRMGEPT